MSTSGESLNRNIRKCYVSLRVFRPSTNLFCCRFSLPHRDCCLVDLSFQKVWGSPCSCVDWDNGVGAFEWKKKAAEIRLQTIQHVIFFEPYCTLILVVTTIGKGDNPTYRTIQANKARNVASSILGPWCGIGCFVGGSTAKCWRRHFWWWHIKKPFYPMRTIKVLIFSFFLTNDYSALSI